MEIFTKTEFIKQLMECYRKGKGIRGFKDYLIFTEISPADSERYNLFVWKKSGNYTPIIHFYDLRINDNNQIEEIHAKIVKEICPRQKSLEDIIKDYEDGKIDFKECNRQAKSLEDR